MLKGQKRYSHLFGATTTDAPPQPCVPTLSSYDRPLPKVRSTGLRAAKAAAVTAGLLLMPPLTSWSDGVTPGQARALLQEEKGQNHTSYSRPLEHRVYSYRGANDEQQSLSKTATDPRVRPAIWSATPPQIRPAYDTEWVTRVCSSCSFRKLENKLSTMLLEKPINETRPKTSNKEMCLKCAMCAEWATLAK